MTKYRLSAASLVTAIPAAYLAYILVMTFLQKPGFDKMAGFFQIISGGTLVLVTLMVLMPVGILIFGKKPEKAPEAEKKSSEADAEDAGEKAEAADEEEALGGEEEADDEFEEDEFADEEFDDLEEDDFTPASITKSKPGSIAHDYRESLTKLRDWVARQSDAIRTCFDIVASPGDFQRLWLGYQKKVPNTPEDRRGREMAEKMGIPFEDLTPDLLIGNVYDVLNNRDNERLPKNVEQWIDATVREYQKNVAAFLN